MVRAVAGSSVTVPTVVAGGYSEGRLTASGGPVTVSLSFPGWHVSGADWCLWV